MNRFTSHSSARVAAVSKPALLALLGAAALSLFSFGAVADVPVPQQRVDFADLDLTTARDTKRLYSRLRNASLEVCSGLAKSRAPRMRDRHQSCVDRALTDAIATIANPSLTALHASKGEMRLTQRGSGAMSRS